MQPIQGKEKMTDNYILGSGLVIPEKCFKCKYDSNERLEKYQDCKKVK